MTALRQLAVDIMGKTKKAHKPPSSTPASKSVSHVTEESKKRKNRSFSTERGASTSGATPEAKAARVNSSPPANNTSSSTVVSQAEAEDNDDIIADEDGEPSLDDFADDMRAALPTYAQNAKGEKRKDYPFILYVHYGSDERKTMPRETWNILFEKVQVVCLDRAFKDDMVSPKIEWSGFSKGVGVIAPVDMESQIAMQEIVSGIKVAEHSFRAWAKGERGRFTPLSILIPATMKKEVFSAGKIMQAAVLMNNLPEEKHIIRSCKEFSGRGKQRLLRIGAEEDLAKAIRDKNGVIYIAASKLEVFYQQKRITTSTSFPSDPS